MLRIMSFNQPNEEVIKEVREVEAICKEYDAINRNLFIDASMNFSPEIESLFLLYEDDKLASFLSMFAPTREEAEISAYTLPEYRQKGYFTRLLHESILEMKKYGIPSLVIVCESGSKDGREVIKKLNAELDFTEYFLKYKKPSVPSAIQQGPGVKLRKAEQKDIEAIIGLNQAIFNDTYEDAESFVTKCYESDNRDQYVALLDGNPVGMASVYHEKDQAFLFGVGVSPQYQGKGFGKEIMNLLLSDLHRRGIENIAIEVDSTNDNAYNLYLKCGFEVEASVDYYRKSGF